VLGKTSATTSKLLPKQRGLISKAKALALKTM
jgi:hypothetical protein